MDPSASFLNMHFSIEKFLWDNIASPNSVLLIHQDDATTRLEEVLETDRAVVWYTTGLAASNKGELTLYVGAMTSSDPGSIKRLNLLDSIKEAFDTHGGIEVLQYENTGLITEPETKVNELAIIGPVQIWPGAPDRNINYTTKFASQKLKFAQRVIAN